MDRAGEKPAQTGDHYWVRANVTPTHFGGTNRWATCRCASPRRKFNRPGLVQPRCAARWKQAAPACFARGAAALPPARVAGFSERVPGLDDVRMDTVGALSASVLMADVLGLQGWQALAWRVVALVLVGSGMVLYCRYNCHAAKRPEPLPATSRVCNLTTQRAHDFPIRFGCGDNAAWV